VHVQDRVLVVPFDSGAPRLLTEKAGRFLAPWWLADGSVALVVGDHIVAHGPDGDVRPLAGPVVAGRFALDAEGRRLAFVDVLQEIPCLVVLDLDTGERTVAATEPVAGFFWSPVGHRLAVLVGGGPGELRWLVSDDDRFERLEPFRPGVAWAREVLPFFEQYAQSHAVWSPDANSLVALAMARDGSPEAVVQSAQPPFTTERVPHARLAWWAGG
jgi:TolB protein